MKFSWFVVIIPLMLSCGKEDSHRSEASMEIVSGDNQTGTAANNIEKPLILKVNSALWSNGFMIRAKMKTGNGFVSSKLNEDFLGVFMTTDGTFNLNWNLGCDVENQEVVLYLFHYKYCDKDAVKENACAPLDSISFQAKTILPKGWVKTCGLSQFDVGNTRLTVVHGDSYLVNYKTLYIPDFTLITSWKPYSESLRYLVNKFAISPSGKLYIGSEGGLYTFDANKLEFLTEKIDRSAVISILPEDSVLFCNFGLNDGLYRIRSKESEWKFLPVAGNTNREFRTFLRHPNGDLYALEDDQDFWISHDNGDSWIRFQEFNKYIGFESFNFGIHPTGLLYLGTNDGMLRIISPVDYSVIEEHSHIGEVSNICFQQDAVYYLADGKIWSSSNNWQALELGFNKSILSFSIDAENRIYIESSDGIYAFRK